MKIDFAHARGEARSQEPGPGAGGIRGGGGGGQEVARRVRRHWDKLYNCSIHTHTAQPSPALHITQGILNFNLVKTIGLISSAPVPCRQTRNYFN